MKKNFKPGDEKKFTKIITEADTAGYVEGFVHAVYSTFCIARDAEWCGRLFVLEMRDDDEEGIGTMIFIQHLAPAFPGEEIIFTSKIKSLNHHEIITAFKAEIEDRMIAIGEQGQKIFKKEKLKKIFSNPIVTDSM
ncbi:MAG: hypothetical protein H0W62_04415 [Chitinophagales bacterium]|nr:hypothetical protein [Chitinophagales bacterium]